MNAESEPQFAPRPLRLAEVLWDFFPLTAGGLLLLLLFNLNPVVWPPDEGAAAVLTPVSIALAFVVPIGGGIMMQFSGYSLLQRITLPEWRESLWLSGIPAGPYLVSQLKARAMLQSVPFVIGAVFCVSAAAFGLILLRGEPRGLNLAGLAFGAALIYALLSLQWCAFCAGHLGHLDRLRALCRADASGVALHFVSLKWMMIIGATPVANGVLGVLTGELASQCAEYLGAADPVVSQTARLIACALYGVGACTLLNLFFYRRLSLSWKKAQVEFFKFEG